LIGNINIFAQESKEKTNNTATSYDKLSLIWQDEFDYQGFPDPAKWSYDVGGHGWGNGEKQYYTKERKENVWVKDGKLYITARKENYERNKYTSARLVTKNNGDWLYKRIEVRAKLPQGRGTWPAIWMLPTHFEYGQWPGSGEIDIMEHVGYDMEIVHGTVHTKSFNHSINTQKGSSMYVEDVHKKFNTYSIEWYPNEINFFINNIHYFTFDNRMETWREWPFDIPFHLILNIAIGGGWGGVKGIDDSIWPQTMEIDYVRVYGLNINKRDNSAPTSPSNLKIDVNPINAGIQWDNSNDDFGIKEYRIFLDNKLVGKTIQNNYILKNLMPETKYDIHIEVIDYADNVSKSKNKKFKTLAFNHHTVPGKIEAEDYLLMEKGVETEKTEDIGGGVNLCYIGDHDWMEYTVDVKNNGTYQAFCRFAAVIEGEIQIKDHNDKILSAITVPVTDGWQNWTTVSSDKFYLQKGKQRIRIYTKIGGFNLNWIELKKMD